MKRFWIAKDSDGWVSLYGSKPRKDKSGNFWSKDSSNELDLGFDPTLTFKLKKGEKKRIKIKI